jgi:hypothetical protein
MRASMLALALLVSAPTAIAETGESAQTSAAEPDSDRTAGDRDDAGDASEPAAVHFWHLPRKRDWRPHFEPPREGESDWNLLASAAEASKRALGKTGIRLSLDTALYGQFASETAMGDRNLGTHAWQSIGDLPLLRHDAFGTSFVQWVFLGSTGLNYDTGDRSMSGNIGSISDLNANVFPHDAALDELFLKHVSPGGKLVALAGRVDLSYYFDTNRVANDDYRQFFAFAFSNNLSIPFATYGGVGGLVRYAPSESLYVMAGAATAVNDEPWAFWRSADDGDWGELIEIGLNLDLPYLGVGHCRITPWHNHRSGADGWGFGFNFDQEIGFDRLIAFFRLGIGDDDVTGVERFVSGGLALERPFGREDDLVSLGIAWSDPSPGAGNRSETLLEFYYRLAISPSIAITPDLQIALDPANNPNDDAIVIGGVRLEMRF